MAPAATVAALSAETSPAAGDCLGLCTFRWQRRESLITAELREQAEFAQLSRTRVAREMQTLGLRCRLRMAKKPRTTQSNPTHRAVGNQYEEWCLNTLRFTMPGRVSIRAMVGRHHNSMKMNLRKNSAEPLNYESIFSGQGHTFSLMELWYAHNYL